MPKRTADGHLTPEGYAQVIQRGGVVWDSQGKNGTRREVRTLANLPAAPVLVSQGVLTPEEAKDQLDAQIAALEAQRAALVNEVQGNKSPDSSADGADNPGGPETGKGSNAGAETGKGADSGGAKNKQR